MHDRRLWAKKVVAPDPGLAAAKPVQARQRASQSSVVPPPAQVGSGNGWSTARSQTQSIQASRANSVCANGIDITETKKMIALGHKNPDGSPVSVCNI
jgi:hypothetical protein